MKNMQLIDQVCSLHLAKKLQSLGVKQESVYYWSKIPKKDSLVLCTKDQISGALEVFSAFTASELGELLPQIVHFGRPHPSTIRLKPCEHIPKAEYELMKKRGLLYISKPVHWVVHYQLYNIFGHETWTHANSTISKTMVNAMAKMLIYLLKKKYITLK